MTKQQETPRHCLGQMSLLNSRERHTISHTDHTGHGKHCVKAKSREKQSKRQTDRQPVIQVDYCIVNTGPDVGQRLILTAVEVQTGLATPVLVANKGRHMYSIAELKKFSYVDGHMEYFSMTKGQH